MFAIVFYLIPAGLEYLLVFLARTVFGAIEIEALRANYTSKS